jgi:hypothetical protein
MASRPTDGVAEAPSSSARSPVHRWGSPRRSLGSPFFAEGMKKPGVVHQGLVRVAVSDMERGPVFEGTH